MHLVGCLYYLYQWCTVNKISDNEIYLLIKYIKIVLWKVAKCLSYIEEARCLKFNLTIMQCSPVPSYLIPLRPIYLPQRPILKIPSPCVPPSVWERPCFTPIRNIGKPHFFTFQSHLTLDHINKILRSLLSHLLEWCF